MTNDISKSQLWVIAIRAEPPWTECKVQLVQSSQKWLNQTHGPVDSSRNDHFRWTGSKLWTWTGVIHTEIGHQKCEGPVSHVDNWRITDYSISAAKTISGGATLPWLVTNKGEARCCLGNSISAVYSLSTLITYSCIADSNCPNSRVAREIF